MTTRLLLLLPLIACGSCGPPSHRELFGARLGLVREVLSLLKIGIDGSNIIRYEPSLGGGREMVVPIEGGTATFTFVGSDVLFIEGRVDSAQRWLPSLQKPITKSSQKHTTDLLKLPSGWHLVQWSVFADSFSFHLWNRSTRRDIIVQGWTDGRLSRIGIGVTRMDYDRSEQFESTLERYRAK